MSNTPSSSSSSSSSSSENKIYEFWYRSKSAGAPPVQIGVCEGTSWGAAFTELCQNSYRVYSFIDFTINHTPIYQSETDALAGITAKDREDAKRAIRHGNTPTSGD